MNLQTFMRISTPIRFRCDSFDSNKCSSASCVFHTQRIKIQDAVTEKRYCDVVGNMVLLVADETNENELDGTGHA